MIKIQNLTAGYGKTIVLSHINLELKMRHTESLGQTVPERQLFFVY